MPGSLRQSAVLLRRLARAAVGRDLPYRRQLREPRLALGSEYGRHCICPTGIDEHSVVYSVGVGTDASFDLELIDRFGMTVHAFDPTPVAVGWVESQEFTERFQFHPYGLLDRDGTVIFQPPQQEGFASYSVIEANRVVQNEVDQPIECPVRRLQTIMEELGHDHVDILKMDIEGAEYDVIEDILNDDVDVRQVLVEFHHRDGTLEQTRHAVQRLNRHGYGILDVSPSGREFAFLRR